MGSTARGAGWAIPVAAALVLWAGACQRDPVPARVRTFVNRVEGLPADLRDSFIPFTFDYPMDWAIAPEANRAGMFVQLMGPLVAGSRPDEVVSVYPFHVVRETELALELEAWSTAVLQVHGFERARVEPIELAGRKIPSVLLDGLRGEDGESVWGRVVLVPIGAHPDGGLRGVVIEMIGSSLVPGLSGPHDLGRMSGTAYITGSLRAFVGDREGWTGASGREGPED